MSITLQKIAGGVLLGLILAWVSGLAGETLVHRVEPGGTVFPQPEQQAAVPAGKAEAEPAQPLPVLLAAATPEQGQAAARKCVSCHTFKAGEPHKVGPNLADVVGKDIAAKPGFTYSPALQGLEGAWTHEKLDEFLTNPRGFAPGTKMTFAGVPSAKERAELIAYLRSVTPSPPPLPQ